MFRNLRKLLKSNDTGHDPQAALDSDPGPDPARRVFRNNLVTHSQIGQTLVVTIVDQELHTDRAHDINDEVRRLWAATPGVRNLVLDLENIKYLDSAGLNSFVDLLSLVKQSDGRVAVAAATQQVEVLFKLTRLELIFLIRRTVIEAIDAVERAG